MRQLLCVLVAGVCLFASSVANAAVVFGYQVVSSPQFGAVTFDGNTLTMSGATTVDFKVDVNGAVTDFDDATLTLNAVRQDTIDLGGGDNLLIFDGSFSVTLGSNVVTWAFTDADLFLGAGANAAALQWSSGVGTGSPVPGPAMVPLLGGESLIAPFDFAFTLTNLVGNVSAFTAQTSFSGSAQITAIPEPAAFGTLLIGAAALLRRRSSRLA